MKKGLTIIIIAALAAIATATLAGCGSASAQRTDTTAPATTAAVKVEETTAPATTAPEATAAAEETAPVAKETAPAADNSAKVYVDNGVNVQDTALNIDESCSSEPTTPDGCFDVKSVVRNDIANYVQNSGANNYTICKISGTHKDVLVLTYGEAELDRTYAICKLDDGEINPLGTISGAHTVAYIDSVSGCLSLFKAHSGAYGYGPVCCDGGLRVEYNDQGTVPFGEAYPALNGTPVTFHSVDDLSLIMAY